jgi:hypothetical protein
VICALLVIAGGHKLLVPRGARESLALIGVSAPKSAVRVLGAGEAALGVAAAVGPAVLTGTLVAVFYAVFSGFVVLLLVRNPGAADCGCFGAGEHTAGWLHVVLNALACGIAGASAVVGAHGLAWIVDGSPLIVPSLIIGMLAATYAAYLAYTVVPQAWSSYRSVTAR